MTIKVLQFGEGNFLRAFVDKAFQDLNDICNSEIEVHAVSPIDVDFIIDKLKAQNCEYTVVIEGIMAGKEVCEKSKVSVIKNAFNAHKNWSDLLKKVIDPDLKLIVSNTTEAGIEYDESCSFNDAVPSSFPAKMTKLLFDRFANNQEPLIILPCELIEENGKTLKECILKYIKLWNLNSDFNDYINKCTFYNTLVDRIVPGYPAEQADEIRSEIGWNDELIVKAEPFGFFAIEKASGDADLETVIPLTKSTLDVIYTSDLPKYRERKVFLLNAPHTAMAAIGLKNGKETVREMLTEEPYASQIRKMMFDEIIPVIDLPKSELETFANAVIDRFLNPFNRHELSSISLNQEAKFVTRIQPIIDRWEKMFPTEFESGAPETCKLAGSIINGA